MAITLDGSSGINTSASVTTGTGAIYNGLQSATAQASTSGTSITFSSIPSWVKRITVMFNGVSTSGTNRLQVQIGSGSVTTTGYVASGSNISVTAANQTSLTTGFPVADATAAADVVTGVATISLISGNIWIFAFNGARNATASNAIGTGILSLGGVLDRVVLTTVGGTDTFDAGSVNIIYE